MDRHTGFVRFGFRDYDPQVGRFTAKDPIGDTGGDHDLYDYCVDDPVSFVDPEGLKEKAVGKATVGFWKSYAPFFHAHKDESIREGIIKGIREYNPPGEIKESSSIYGTKSPEYQDLRRAIMTGMRQELEPFGKNLLGGHLIVIDERTKGLVKKIIESKRREDSGRDSPKNHKK